MSDSVETVKIKSGDDYAIINRSDFDESKHQLFGESEKPKQPRKAKSPNNQE